MPRTLLTILVHLLLCSAAWGLAHGISGVSLDAAESNAAGEAGPGPGGEPGTGLAESGTPSPSQENASGSTAASSYWGVFPARSDSTSAAFLKRKKPFLEQAFAVPYWVIKLPFAGFFWVFEKSAVFLDESGTIFTIRQLFARRDVPYGIGVGVTASDLSGFGGSLSYNHFAFFGPENKMRLALGGTTKGKQKYTLGTVFSTGGGSFFDLGGGYRLQPNARFFGIGPESDQANESFYTQETGWVAARYRRGLAKRLSLHLSGMFSAAGTRGPREGLEDRSIEFVFAGNLPPGYGARADGVSFHLAMVHDNAKETGRPSSGGIQRLKGAYYESTDSKDGDYWTTRLEVEQFFPFLYPDRTFAIRYYVVWIDQVGTTSIPFQLLYTNDAPDLLRGYQDFRFRDFGMTALTLEYRWPIWAFQRPGSSGLDAFLFSDFGQVFDSARQISVENMTTSLGLGLRLIGRNGFLLRFEFGWSREESEIRLESEQTFQFVKDAIFNGKLPIPLR